MQRLNLFFFICATLPFMGCDDDDNPITFPDEIIVTSETLYPEGVAFNFAANEFYLGSLFLGKIGRVDLAGNYSEFITDDELIGAVGLHLSNDNSTLYVATSDPGFVAKSSQETGGTYARVLGFNTQTREKVLSVNLAALNPNAGNFANDVTQDNQGNLYVTNSFSPLIFRVNSTNNSAEVLVEDQRWQADGFGLNGIVYHPDGYLLVIQSETGLLYKVSLDGQMVDLVTIDRTMIDGDGLILNNDNQLIAVANGSSNNLESRVFQVNSSNDWSSATITDEFIPNSSFNFPSTGTKIADNNYYIIHAKLNELFSGGPLTNDFLLERVEF
ncbi:MAG: hypothetical protein AAF960_09960 [Bacteroidota bacterium]